MLASRLIARAQCSAMKRAPLPTPGQQRPLIEVGHPASSLRHQCELLGLSRSGLSYAPAGETPEDLRLMRLVDEQLTLAPFDGSRRMTEWLTRRGEEVNRKRV
jgi:putative transposase